MRSLSLALLLACPPAFAQDPCPPCPPCAVVCDPDDDEPGPLLMEGSQSPRASVVVETPPAPPRRSPGRAVGELAAMPGYMRLLGSDFLGTQVTLGVGGRARSTGFVALARFGGFFGASTFGVPFEHLTIAAVFEIPTGTRLRLTLGHQLGVLILQEAHTYDRSAFTVTMGGFLEPTVDVYRRESRRLFVAARVAYDFIEADNPNVLTINLGVGYSF